MVSEQVNGCQFIFPLGSLETEEVSYYHYDGLGSVIAISDANGEIVERVVSRIFRTFCGVMDSS